MPVTFDQNDEDWFRTLLGTKLRSYAGSEPTQAVAAQVAREMLQEISQRVAVREQLEAQLAGTTTPAP